MTHDAPQTSWQALDLADIVAGVQAGEIVGPVPALMPRSDGPFLLYPGEVHSLSGEPESGKGWIALATAVEVIAAGARVVYFDFEDAPASIVTRLLALGADPEHIVERFVYVRPTDPFTGPAFAALLETGPYTLAIIDGVSEAYALLALDPYNNPDAASFLAALPRPLADRGAAVLEIDHVVKSKEARGRYAIGAQHKLAGIAVSYSTDVIKTPSRTTAGLTKIKVGKDRHGHVRGHARGEVIAHAHIVPSDEGERVSVTLDPPDRATTDEPFRPTNLMEKVSRLVEGHAGAGVNTIRRDVRGKAEWVDAALDQLINEGYIERRQEGPAKRHYSITTYREINDPTTVSQPCPDRVPDTPEGTVSRVPALKGGTRQDTRSDQHQNGNRVPDPDAELARIEAQTTFPDRDSGISIVGSEGGP